MPRDNTTHPQMRAVVTTLAFLCFVPAPLSCDAWIIPSLTRLQLRSTASSAQSDIAPKRVRQSLAYTSDLTNKWKVTQHSAFPIMCNDDFMYMQYIHALFGRGSLSALSHVPPTRYRVQVVSKPRCPFAPSVCVYRPR